MERHHEYNSIYKKHLECLHFQSSKSLTPETHPLNHFKNSHRPS